MTNILHFWGLLYLYWLIKSVIVAFNYQVLFIFVINESMKLCVSENLLWNPENV